MDKYKNHDNWSQIANKLTAKSSAASSIAIKSNLLGSADYPFTTSVELHELIIETIRSVSEAELLLIESEFNDASWSQLLADKPEVISYLKKHSVKLVRANKEVKIVVDESLIAPLYIPKSWYDAQLRINISNVVVNKHHSERSLHSSLLNLATILYRKDNDFSNFSKKDYLAAALFDLKNLDSDAQELQKSLPILTIVDGVEVGYTDEHSPYTHVEKLGSLLAGEDFNAIDSELRSLLNIKKR
ncbi:MAG: DUF362 domain-containing protein [Candidatus Dojkabacteria bacterium]|nr:MAG: DUF362 domain-containing protein [Candidatus Dojkabacteria bacterium]